MKMAYKIAFIGYNEEQTNRYLEDLAVVNADQVHRFDRRQGCVTLKDGTTITAVKPVPEFLIGRRFDQVIVADDRRLAATYRRAPEMRALDLCMVGSVVPEHFRWMLYDLDAEV
jgi:hypothetical protein